MTVQAFHRPRCTQHGPDEALARVLRGRPRDLDGTPVRRLLPSRAQPMVGPFIFLDHMGPVEPGASLDIRPHPHIHLAAVFYLFAGEALHRDSEGHRQVLRPGELNWLTAGRGVTHSERPPEPGVRSGDGLHGIQAWLALPVEHEDTAPAFVHAPAASLPRVRAPGVGVRVLAGRVFGASSPVPTLSPMFYADARLEPGARLELAWDEHDAALRERAVYVAEGSVTATAGAARLDAGALAVARPGRALELVAGPRGARAMLLGGAPLGQRFIEWNFVSSSRASIDAAKRAWRDGRFPRVPGDDEEAMPLPDRARRRAA